MSVLNHRYFNSLIKESVPISPVVDNELVYAKSIRHFHLVIVVRWLFPDMVEGNLVVWVKHNKTKLNVIVDIWYPSIIFCVILEQLHVEFNIILDSIILWINSFPFFARL